MKFDEARKLPKADADKKADQGTIATKESQEKTLADARAKRTAEENKMRSGSRPDQSNLSPTKPSTPEK